MGYESRAYIVRKFKDGFNFPSIAEEKKVWAQCVAQFNLCCAGNFYKVFNKEADCFIYADDGNMEILKDKYDEPLKEASVDDVIQWLEAEGEKDDYWRFTALLETLRAIKKSYDGKSIEDIAVLHYGY